MPAAMGIRTCLVTAARAAGLRPGPSLPNSNASRSGGSPATSLNAPASGCGVSARISQPSAERSASCCRPRRCPCPWKGEHGPHRHPDRSSVERVGAGRVDENGIKAETRRRTKYCSHIRVVDDSLKHHDASGTAHHVLDSAVTESATSQQGRRGEPGTR